MIIVKSSAACSAANLIDKIEFWGIKKPLGHQGAFV
jgi:hypothetical protein